MLVETVAFPLEVLETGKLVLPRVKGAKEDYSSFIATLNRDYKLDQMTVRDLLRFAYGLVNWQFDPTQLRQYCGDP